MNLRGHNTSWALLAMTIVSLGVVVWLFLPQKNPLPPPTAPGAPGLSTSASAALGAFANFVLAEQRIPAPEITLVAPGGNPLPLSNWRGKLVLLNFWATWCAPCRREMGDLDRLEKALGGDRFEVLALSSDRNGFPVIDKFYRENDIRHLRQLHDPKMQAQRAFKVLGLPTTYLIDAKGNIIGHMTGPAEWSGPVARKFVARYLP